MNLDTLTRGIMIAQCLETIEQAQDLLNSVMYPQLEDNDDMTCDECRVTRESIEQEDTGPSFTSEEVRRNLGLN